MTEPGPLADLITTLVRERFGPGRLPTPGSRYTRTRRPPVDTPEQIAARRRTLTGHDQPPPQRRSTS